MIDDVFVFDGVAHPVNIEAKHAFGGQFPRKWTIEDIQRMVYDESDTDMLVVMPLTDPFADGLSQCAEPAHRDPDRTVFWGPVNPLEGGRALDLMERQVGEFGAKAFKFHTARHDHARPFPWRMDDPQVAFPIFEKAQDLGVNLIAVHRGVPLGPQPIEHTRTWDMNGAAENFPGIDFVIHHVGPPLLDETCWQLIRYPNLYVSLAATINFLVRTPRMFAEIIGKLLFWCGEDKIVYGSEAPICHPQGTLRAFMDFQIPQDLCDDHGYPQLTETAKRKILGENLLRLHGMTLAAAKAKTAAPTA